MSYTPPPKQYGFRVFWDYADECWIAEAPDLPGVVTYGKTAEEAAKNAVEAIEAFTSSANRHHDPLPEPRFPR